MPHLSIFTLDIECTDNAVRKLTPAIHRLPPDARFHPEAKEHPLVRVVGTERPPHKPLFHIKGTHYEAAVRNAHELFTRLVVTRDPNTGVERELYTAMFRYWVKHYTQLDSPAAETIDEIVSHRIWEGRRQDDGRKEYYHGISLDTTPFIVFLGQRWEVNDG